MADHKSMNAALAAFQAEVPKMSKDEHAKVTGKSKETGERYDRSYNYAGLDQFVEIAEPILGKHGLSLSSVSEFDDKGRFVLVVTLCHESGEERSGVWPLPDPYGRGVGPQDIGSAMTYGRRYLGWALTGTFPGGIDDDGAKAQQRADRESWDSARPREERPVSAPPATPKTSWTDEEVLKLVTPMPVAQVEKAVAVYDWMAARNLHKRVVEMDYKGSPVKVTATDLIAGRIADEALVPYATVNGIKGLQALANDRGLMKVQVSESETLAEALYSAQELAAHAEADQGTQDGSPTAAPGQGD